MELIWYELSRDDSRPNRWAAASPASGAIAYGHTPDVALERLRYAIGVAKPVSVKVDTFGTGAVGDEVLSAAVQAVFDLRPKAIIESLDLLKPIYRETAYHGHFGRKEFSWEKTNKIAELQDAVKKLAVTHGAPKTAKIAKAR